MSTCSACKPSVGLLLQAWLRVYNLLFVTFQWAPAYSHATLMHHTAVCSLLPAVLGCGRYARGHNRYFGAKTGGAGHHIFYLRCASGCAQHLPQGEHVSSLSCMQCVHEVDVCATPAMSTTKWVCFKSILHAAVESACSQNS